MRVTRSIAAVNAIDRNLSAERYVVGSFWVKAPVKTKKTIPPAEQVTLAIIKHDLGKCRKAIAGMRSC